MLGELVIHCQTVFVEMLNANYFQYVAEPTSESEDFEMRLRSAILKRDLESFFSAEEGTNRGFTLDRTGRDWSLPDLISKKDTKKCFELKCSNLLWGTHIGSKSNNYGKVFEDGTYPTRYCVG